MNVQYLRPHGARVAAWLRRHRRRLAALLAVLLALAAGVLLWPMDTGHYLVTEASGELLDRAGRPLHAFLNARQQWCFEQPLEAISPHLVRATLAVEDRRFWRHPGVDPLAAARAGWQLLRHRRVRSGASTLTMQVVKLAGHPSRTPLGKLRQMSEALRLNLRAEKRRILAAYLNHAPYGLNLVGCEAAARRYFGKPARELTLSEAALLAALPKAPSRLMPLGRGAASARDRRNFVLRRMRETGCIGADECRRALASPLGAGWHGFPRLAPHVAWRMADSARRRTALRTTLDAPIQSQAEEMLRAHLEKFGGDIGDGALIVADVPTASALAWVGSGDFRGHAPAGCFDAARARRSPGSTLKPFIYALGIERNCLFSTEVLLDGSFDLGTYNPRNFDKRYHGLIPVANALRQSLNVPAVMALNRIGQPAVYDFLRQAGLTTLRRPARDYGLGLALGNCEARLDQLSAAYCALAGLGLWRPLTVRPDAARSARQLLARGTALSLYDMLEQPLPGELDAAAAGTVNAASRVCWKTGTSTGNHDAWAFVFNSQYLVGVWLGNPDGRASRRLVGAEAALPLAGRVFRRLPPRPGPQWPDPGDDMQAVEVCATSGLPRSGWCEHTLQAWLPRRQLVGRICDVHWPEGGIQDDREYQENRGEERPRVVERWPGSAKNWDLARIQAPVVAGRREEFTTSAPIYGLQILNPPNAARFILTGEGSGDRIRLRSSTDQQGPVHWYFDGRFLATAQPGRPVMLDLTTGRHKLVCMTPQGATTQVRFQVVPPSSRLRFSEDR